MADYGVTPQGFVLKRLEDIKADIETLLRAEFGEIDTTPASVFGQVIGVLSAPLAELWEQAQNVYNSLYPVSAEGVSLDRASDFTGAVRLAATPSVAVAQMGGDDTTVVPIATTISQSTTGEQFTTDAELTISGTACQKARVAIDDVQSAHSYVITINDTEITYLSGGSATAAEIAEGLSDAINADSGLAAVLVAEFEIATDTFLISSRSFGITDTLAVLLSSDKLAFDQVWSPVNVTAVNSGAVPVPIGSLDTIDTPVSGLDEVTNLGEGTTGRDLETDGDFRIRRRRSLGLVAAGTLSAITARLLQDLPTIVTNVFIFENATGSEDSEGRPPHSFETVVAATDSAENRAAIAAKIWERKPAGIRAYGDVSETVQDSNGNDQVVGFTFAGTKYAHLELTYSRTGADKPFPTNGEALIAAELLRIGQSLTFGSDLLIQKFQAAGYVVDGVTSVTMRMAVTNNPGDSPSWGTTNIVIATSDLPSFDASRITVQEA